ncbi:MAG: pyridine nucleotide-disulfide oxidoreductase, partial [Gammaproteobacteria bacterium]|nr:pyridine nucleotide-disulfide oxidoreductase [Gammaproteobacteria bacterium]
MPDLELHGFAYADLHQPAALPKLDALFLEYLDDRDCTLAERFKAYRAGEKLEHVAESELLIAAARHLEDFLVRAFGAAHARDALRTAQIQDEPVHAFKERFAKQRARRKRAIPARPFAQLDALIGRAIGSDAATDRELAVARLWEKAERENDAALLALLEEWVWAACNTAEGKTATTGWCSLSFPNKLDYFRLVPAHALQGDAAGRVTGSPERQRRRDGFNLTDPRCDLREAMDQVHYCVYCHTHDGDFCSKGFPDKDSGAFRINPLGVDLTGCPLEEKISQAHVLKLEGYTLGALAVIMIDNPLLPATGHRICNDCMKSCIYQKQEPVNIPQIETRILTDVLGWPWGFEIYFLLTRWNPLNRERPYALPYNGVKVLCAGAGPAGFTLSYHLLQAGFGVVAIDGLKIEPLPPRWVGTPDRPPQPIQDVRELHEPMDERVMTGFGGVAEYGITARWDKNFLRLIYITLARYPTFRIYGGVRIGGTLTLEDAWDRGFDHVALATGAGKPTVIPMKNNLAQGIRQASDFLMALQLTGAAKKDSLANLQVRLPALVIGGGLTAIDTATEVQVYYVRQVEKILERHETLSATRDVEATLNPIEQGILCEYLAHGREIGKERARAAAAGEAPNFTPLLRAWGGVTVVYRRALHESPAYVRNHEEIEKALQEGIYYAQGLAPVEAKLDEHGHVSAVVFNKQVRDDAGRWHDGDAAVELAARSVFIAAGSVPNTVYEREHPGTFKMDGQY